MISVLISLPMFRFSFVPNWHDLTRHLSSWRTLGLQSLLLLRPASNAWRIGNLSRPLTRIALWCLVRIAGQRSPHILPYCGKWPIAYKCWQTSTQYPYYLVETPHLSFRKTVDSQNFSKNRRFTKLFYPSATLWHAWSLPSIVDHCRGNCVRKS